MRCAPVRPQGLCPRTPTAFEKAGETFTPLRGCAFYSKLLYSWAISSSLVSKPPEAVYRENPSKSERLRFRWAKNRDSLPYGLPSLQQALIQLGNLFLAGIPRVAGAAGVGVGGLGQERHVLLLQNAVEVLGDAHVQGLSLIHISEPTRRS